jgi:saccharopine dehydrogenase-like NADP-dependent oxidoreductase
LRLREDRDQLKQILEKSVPITFQDVVVTFCSVAGWRHGDLVQITDARKIYAGTVGGEHWSAIQITTAAGICAVIDLFLHGQLPQQGFVRQEQVNFEQFLANRFGRHYESSSSTSFSHSARPKSGDRAISREQEPTP